MAAVSFSSPFNSPYRHAFDVSVGGGVGGLLVDTRFTSPTQLGYVARMNVGYTYLFRGDYGMHVGFGLSSVGSGCLFAPSSYEETGSVVMQGNGGAVTRAACYITQLGEMSQSFSLLYLELPLQLALQREHWCCNLGFRFMLPLSGSADYSYEMGSVSMGHSIEGVGGYIDIPIEQYDIPAQQGEYTLAGSAGICNPFYVSVALDGGYRWASSPKHSLYLGLYLDMALNGTSVGGDEYPVEKVEGGAVYTNVMQSVMLSHLRYASVGVVLRYSFGFGKRIDPYRVKSRGGGRGNNNHRYKR